MQEQRMVLLWLGCCLWLWGCIQETPVHPKDPTEDRTSSPADPSPPSTHPPPSQKDKAQPQNATAPSSRTAPVSRRWPPPIRNLLPWFERTLHLPPSAKRPSPTVPSSAPPTKTTPDLPPSSPSHPADPSAPLHHTPSPIRKPNTDPSANTSGRRTPPPDQTNPTHHLKRPNQASAEDDDNDEAFLRKHQGKRKRVTLQTGDTLDRVLHKHLRIEPARLRLELRDELAEFVELRSIRPGHQAEAVFDTKGRLLRLIWHKDLLNEWWIKVCWKGERCDEHLSDKDKETQEKAQWSLFTQKLEVQERLVRRELRLRISSRTPSVSAGVQQAGEGAELALRVAHTFQKYHPVGKIFPGDRLDVWFEQIQVAGRVAGYGRILFARFATKRNGVFTLLHGLLLGPRGPEQMFRTDGTRRRKRRFFGPPTQPYRINSRFGWRYHPVLRKRRMHRGIDVSLPCGRPVFAVAAGQVITRGWRGGAGRMVSIRHAQGWVTRYFHLSRYRIRRGQRVRLGQRIGDIGASGLATGCHLHFEMMRSGRHVDPQRFLRFRTNDEIPCAKMTALWTFQLRACAALGLRLRDCGLVLPRRCYRPMRRRFWQIAAKACRTRHRRCPHKPPQRPGRWPTTQNDE